MHHSTSRKLGFAAVAAVVGLAAITAVNTGCKNGGGSATSGIGSLTSMITGGGGGGGSSDSSSGSGNAVVDAASGFAPGNTGGYLQAGYMGLSGLKLSRDDEDQMGQAVAVQVTNTYPVDASDALNRYVALVGYTVASASPRPDGNFVFGVVDTDAVGAYSGPNGYVMMITRGALQRMRDESELAGVLAHEVAHVCHEDGLNAVRNAKLTGAGAQAAKTALGNDNTGELFGPAVDAATDVVFRKGYDRSQELAADRDAVKYVAAAGYDPAGYQRFVDRMAAENGSGGGGGGASALFSTHPGLGERSKVVSAGVAATGKGGTGATNRDRFQTATASVRG